MLIADALQLIAAKLNALNARHLMTGGTVALQAESWEFSRRAAELQARVNLLAADGPSMDLLAAVGAHAVAAMLALDAVELARVETGSEAA